MSIRHLEFQPCFELQPFVQTYWTAQFNVHAESSFSRAVVPNGYVELIVHLTDEHCCLSREPSCWGRSPDYTLIGLYTSVYEVRFDKHVQVFGVRFFPEGLSNIFGVPAATLKERFEDSTEVLGIGFRDYCHRIREAKSVTQQIQATDEYLRSMLRKNHRRYDYIRLAAEVIREKNGLLNQHELMELVPISVRQLQREFRNQFGLTPKEYMRIARLNAVQRYLESRPSADFGDLTFEHGFADQSHFIREFKMFTGTAPRTFLREKKKFIINI